MGIELRLLHFFSKLLLHGRIGHMLKLHCRIMHVIERHIEMPG